MHITVRAYEPPDREAVRQICCDTADRGGPIENFFPDRGFAADLLTGYYTDYEPSATFVAVADGNVVGYVQGCFDNRQYGLVWIFILIPKALAKGLKKGVFFKPEFWAICGVMARNWQRLFSWRKHSFHSHQGHMHIGIATHARRQYVGQQLVAALLHYAHHQHVDELTASVHSGNISACGFFKQLGFEVRERHPMVMSHGQAIEEYESLLYVKKIS